jgi:NADH-quinone oxidoreductase subunit L
MQPVPGLEPRTLTPPSGMIEDPLLLWLSFAVLLLPLAGFTVLALFGDWIRDQELEARAKGERGGSRVHGSYGAMLIACATVVGSFLLSVLCVRRLLGLYSYSEALKFSQPYLGYEWIAVADFRVPFNLLLDPLSAVMILVVTGVGSLIHIYSLGYMSHDPERIRYFSYLNLFTFFMLLLVLGGSLPLMFVGWEGVGLCSYLLIGFWFKKKSATDAGNKAFIVNRVGDAGLILGTILAFHQFGSVDLFVIADQIGSRPAEALGEFGPLTAIALLLFVGACGKSAQIPLHVWLPDAMEGPTPVSALIHAATMVTAGVYMVARLGTLYHQAPTAMAVVAVIGALTALVAATIAVVQTDIKKVLAYSTVSQLGYMFLAAGVGAFGVAVFHLFTHAFFKALLFLGSGSVIHALSGEQDMRRMGGLRTRIPLTFWTFVVGWIAIMGIGLGPVGLSGYFSKEEILGSVLGAHRYGLFAVALLTAGLTAFYMSRMMFLTFFGEYRGELEQARGHHDAHGHDAQGHAEGHGHAGIHESPWSMLGPLFALAFGSIVVGFIHVPQFIQPAVRVVAPEGHAAWLPFVATGVALLGLALAYQLYLRAPGTQRRLRDSLAGVRRPLEAKYYFDDVYNAFADKALIGGSRELLWKRVDAGLIDGIVNGSGRVTAGLARAVRLAQGGFVRGYALVMLGGAVALLGYLLWRR